MNEDMTKEEIRKKLSELADAVDINEIEGECVDILNKYMRENNLRNSVLISVLISKYIISSAEQVYKNSGEDINTEIQNGLNIIERVTKDLIVDWRKERINDKTR